MNRCWLQGATGDALHAVLCAAGYNIRWLMRAIIRLGIKPIFVRLLLRWLRSIRDTFRLRSPRDEGPSNPPLRFSMTLG